MQLNCFTCQHLLTTSRMGHNQAPPTSRPSGTCPTPRTPLARRRRRRTPGGPATIPARPPDGRWMTPTGVQLELDLAPNPGGSGSARKVRHIGAPMTARECQ